MIESALLCLTLNLYHEARGEPIEGQIAVTLVVLNRAKRNRTSICHEVYRPNQFSWTKKPPAIKKREVLSKLKKVARIATKLEDFTGGADHYHAKTVSPEWAESLVYVGKWGDHLFYKRK